MDWIKLDMPECGDEPYAIWVSGTPNGHELPYAYPYRLYIMRDRVELFTQGEGHQLYLKFFNQYLSHPIPPTHIELLAEAGRELLMYSL